MLSRNSLTLQRKWPCFIIIGLAIVLYVLDSPEIIKTIGSKTFHIYVKPVTWLLITGLLLYMPRARTNSKLRFRGQLIWWSSLSGVLYVLLLGFAGFIDGFGRSMYSHTLKGILLNLFTAGAVLIGREFARNYILNATSKNLSRFILILVSLLFAFLNIPVSNFKGLVSLKETIVFVAETAAPEVCNNFYASFLASLGGPVLSIIYLGIIKSFQLLSPALPAMKWITSALIGIMFPIFANLYVNYKYMKLTKMFKQKSDKVENLFSLLASTLVSILLIWFALGVFPIYPYVIATGSMEPMIMPGDVIILKKIDPSDVQIGDVITFRRDNILITHRVVDTIETDNTTLYVTKGDNNSSNDSNPVKPENIKGKLMTVIPKIGYPTLLLKSDYDVPLDQIEF